MSITIIKSVINSLDRWQCTKKAALNSHHRPLHMATDFFCVCVCVLLKILFGAFVKPRPDTKCPSVVMRTTFYVDVG